MTYRQLLRPLYGHRFAQQKTTSYLKRPFRSDLFLPQALFYLFSIGRVLQMIFSSSTTIVMFVCILIYIVHTYYIVDTNTKKPAVKNAGHQAAAL